MGGGGREGEEGMGGQGRGGVGRGGTKEKGSRGKEWEEEGTVKVGPFNS